MQEFWHKSRQRGQETLAVWRQFRPLMMVGGRLPADHAADIARLETLAQAVAGARTGARAVKQHELAAFARIRALNLNVPRLIAGQFDDGHPVRTALREVQAVVPETDALNLRRARRLLPVWKMADTALAARDPGQTIVRNQVGVAAFERQVEDYPDTVQATADARTAFRAARATLRAQHQKVDRFNKRVYRRFKAEAYTDAALREALATTVTREKTSATRPRRAAESPP